MKVFKNELTVHRNETFTLSKTLQNRDGSPYIVSSEFSNPYWLITVTNKLYDQVDRYIYNKWLNLKDNLRFRNTKPINLKELGYEDWSAVLPAGFEGDETSGYANVAVFSLDNNGIKEYKYWHYNNNNVEDYSGTWVDYSCRIITQFSKNITSEWIEQTYYYGILLVSGESIKEYLEQIVDFLGLDRDDDIYTMYEKIKDIDASFVENIDITKPLVNYDVVYPILDPTRILVQSNLKGGM